VALLGIGAAAWYLFDPHQGPQRRRALRESFLGLGRQASDSVRSAATTVKQAAEDVGEQVSAAVEDRRENDPDRRENDPAE
jgi:gas vesicle protein